MNEDQFRHCVNTLSGEELLLLKSGYSLCLVDDRDLSVKKEGESNGMEVKLSSVQLDAESIRQFLCEQADLLIKQYYRTHPLTRLGFNRQVMSLVQQHGAECFVALPGKAAIKSLFVDDGEVVAEQSGNPRHPYGASCELDSTSAVDAESRVMRWIESGEAYRQYLSMNVCRYNC